MYNTSKRRKTSKCDIALNVFTVIILLLVATAIIILIFEVVDQNSQQRHCFHEGAVDGLLYTKTNEHEIGWDIQYTSTFTGVPNSIQIYGPIPYGLQTGPVIVALCGSPSTLVCDTSIANRVSGHIATQTYDSAPLKPIIQALRDEPWRYYAIMSSTSSSVRIELGNLCGTTN